MFYQLKTAARRSNTAGTDPRNGSKSHRQGLLAAAALAAATMVSGEALADTGRVFLTDLDLAVIEVASDGKTYTAVSGSSPAITGEMYMYLNADKYGRVKSWSLWPSIQAEAAQKKQFPELGYSKSYSLGDRPKKLTRELPFSIPLPAYKAYAKDACNQLAGRLRNNLGKTDEEIFAVDRSIPVTVEPEVTWEMSGSGAENPSLTQVDRFEGNPNVKSVTILCRKAPLAPPAVTGAAVVVQGIDPSFKGNQCQMRLNGSLISNVPNVDVSFRYVDDKGQQSGLQTVNTGDDRSVSFEHNYPLSPGHKTGKVRIVGENLNFTSGWKDFDFECGAEPVNDFQTLLPPEATLLEVGATASEILYKGHVCPAQAKMIGAFKGRGSVSGETILMANDGVMEQKPYSIEDGETKYIDGEYDLSWEHVQGPLEQEVGFAFFVTNANGEVVDRLTKKESFSCVKVYKPDVFASNVPAPHSLSLTATPVGEKAYQGYICPEHVVLDAQILGKDAYEGRAFLVAKQQPSLLESQSQVKEANFSVAKDEQLALSFQPVLKWSNVPQSGEGPQKQTMTFSFKVTRNGVTGASVEKSLVVNCRALSFPTAGVNESSSVPTTVILPPTATLLQVVPTTDEILHQGYICPARVELIGSFQGHGPASGRAVLIAGPRVKAMEEFTIQDGVTNAIRGEHEINWEAVQGSHEQTVDFILRLDNAQGGEIDRLTKTESFSCRKPVVVGGGQGAVGSLATGNPGPGSSQQATKPAAVGQLVLQPGVGFAIQAPKGRVRQGQIKLSGGKPNAKYALRFYRKTGSGFKRVRSAQLPRQMTGTTARFELKALVGSPVWRLEVCSAGSKDKKVCKTSDFSLPMVEGAGKVKTPGKPASTKVFITPGIGN